MGAAREVMDRFTQAMIDNDRRAAEDCYAENAVITTPDAGEIMGRSAIGDYFVRFWDAVPGATYESVAKHETENVAIDEGFVVGTNTGPVLLPTGDRLPATGKKVRVRSCDIARVENGHITSHHMYFDQMEYADQLGLTPELASQGQRRA